MKVKVDLQIFVQLEMEVDERDIENLDFNNGCYIYAKAVENIDKLALNNFLDNYANLNIDEAEVSRIYQSENMNVLYEK